MDQVATILAELAERIDPDRLVAAAKTAPIAWAQRLGYLLEYLETGVDVRALKSYVRKTANEATPLLPGVFFKDPPQDKSWRVTINTEVEAEA